MVTDVNGWHHQSACALSVPLTPLPYLCPPIPQIADCLADQLGVPQEQVQSW